jgi:hypothetical protein
VLTLPWCRYIEENYRSQIAEHNGGLAVNLTEDAEQSTPPTLILTLTLTLTQTLTLTGGRRAAHGHESHGSGRRGPCGCIPAYRTVSTGDSSPPPPFAQAWESRGVTTHWTWQDYNIQGKDEEEMHKMRQQATNREFGW